MTRGEKQQHDYKTTITNSSPTSTTSTTSSSSSTTTTSSSSNSIHTDPGVLSHNCLTEDQMTNLAYLYDGCIGGGMTLPVIELIKDAMINGGLTYEVIRECIRETGFARRPSAYYLRAVINRTIGDSIETLDDWQAAKAEYGYHIRKKWWGGENQ